MAKSTEVLIATQLLIGGTLDKHGAATPAELKAGEELTTEAAKALGLDKDAIADLKDRGALASVSARFSDGGDGAALTAATDRAEAAEARVAELEAELKAALEAAAKKPA